MIVLVFDAWSAYHLQFYGYPRRTMPNLERFAEKATVFHRHYTAGTFTCPGTASLLTGLHPWSHRAFALGGAGVIDAQASHQLFSVFADTHHTLGFAHNKFADTFLCQFAPYLDTHIPTGAFNLERRLFYNLPLFKKDANVAFTSFEQGTFPDDGKHSTSLFINPLFLLWRSQDRLKRDPNYADEYPLGLPDDTEQFLLSDLVDGAIHTLQEITQPSFVYLHFWPPHASYRPTRSFYEDFQDGWQPMEKPMHPRSWDRKPYTELKEANQRYDEYLLSWDAEVSRLFQYLEESGLLDRSYVVITADHGELNERGEEGHFTPLIYEPLIYIPLIVFQPGQKEHKDVHMPTSSVDVLPTLAHLAGKPTPRWAEGRLLPGFGGEEDSQTRCFFRGCQAKCLVCAADENDDCFDQRTIPPHLL